MKKIKHIIAMLIRTIILFIPGIAAAIWLWYTHGWMVSILAALGVEFVIGIVVTFGTAMAAQFKAQRELQKEKEKEEAETSA